MLFRSLIGIEESQFAYLVLLTIQRYDRDVVVCHVVAVIVVVVVVCVFVADVVVVVFVTRWLSLCVFFLEMAYYNVSIVRFEVVKYYWQEERFFVLLRCPFRRRLVD